MIINALFHFHIYFRYINGEKLYFRGNWSTQRIPSTFSNEYTDNTYDLR